MTTTTSTIVHARRTRAVAIAAVGAVLAYVASWAVGGVVWEGYDPARQAISELFAIGSPVATRLPLSVGLVGSGVGLVAFGWALEVVLPGRGRAGPMLAALSGLMTAAIVAFPCTAGCPGYGSSMTDSMHVVVAGTGYVALILAPLAVAQRVHAHEPSFARASLLIGGLAMALFVVATLGALEDWGGLQQRLYNTTADLWYVLAAAFILRRPPRQGDAHLGP